MPTRPPSRTGPSCGASTTPARTSTRASPGPAAPPTSTSTPRRRSRSRPGRPRRSSRSSTTGSTSAIRTSPRAPGRTPARAATARRPTASTTTRTATSTTSTAGTSATTTTPSTTSTTTSTAPTSPGSSRRRSTASASSGSPRASRSWPSSSSATTRTAASTRWRSRRSTTPSRSACGSPTRRGAAWATDRCARAARRDPRLGDALHRRRGQQRRRTTTRARVTTLPASFDLPNIVSVAAVDNTAGWPRSRTTARRTVDIAAPGEGILSTLPADTEHPDARLGLARRDVDGDAARRRASRRSSLGLAGAGRRPGRAQGTHPRQRQAVTVDRGPDRDRPDRRRLARPRRHGRRWPRSRTRSRSSSGRRCRRRARPCGSAGRPRPTIGRGSAHTGSASARGSGAGRRPWRRRRRGSADRSLTIGTAWGLRVRARDGAGNWGDWSNATTITPARYQETSTKVTYRGTWRSLRTVVGVGRPRALRDAQGRLGQLPVHGPGGRDRGAEGRRAAAARSCTSTACTCRP